jgi:DNA-binding NarL/FixJ family response regulator
VDTVLIVDDSVMLINYLRDSFERRVHKLDFLTANNGLRLLAYTNEYHPSIPCIVMSAHGTPKIMETLPPDIIQFIEKPFTAEELAQVIVSALKRGRLNGSLSGISIASFLTMIQLEQKTCLCEVESPNNPKGFFYFKGGELYHAVCAGLKGKEAAIKMIQIEDATISFRKPPDREIPRRIKADLTALILEAVRLMDES